MKVYFDPGGACAAWAAYEGTEMVACGLLRTKLKSPGDRARAHREALRALYPTAPIRSESMIQRGGRSRVPPQDLIDLNLIAGHVGTEWVTPEMWKGRIPKEEHQPIILSKLTPKEFALIEAVMPKSLRHNVVDAAGIGLNDVGRLGAVKWDYSKIGSTAKSGTAYPKKRKRSGVKSKTRSTSSTYKRARSRGPLSGFSMPAGRPHE